MHSVDFLAVMKIIKAWPQVIAGKYQTSTHGKRKQPNSLNQHLNKALVVVVRAEARGLKQEHLGLINAKNSRQTQSCVIRTIQEKLRSAVDIMVASSQS